MHLTKLDFSNRKIYDKQDRPRILAKEAREIVERIIGAEDKYNYIRAKAIAQIGKADLVEKKQEKAEDLFLEAQTQIAQCFGNESPLVAKYN